MEKGERWREKTSWAHCWMIFINKTSSQSILELIEHDGAQFFTSDSTLQKQTANKTSFTLVSRPTNCQTKTLVGSEACYTLGKIFSQLSTLFSQQWLSTQYLVIDQIKSWMKIQSKMMIMELWNVWDMIVNCGQFLHLFTSFKHKLKMSPSSINRYRWELFSTNHITPCNPSEGLY